MTVYQHMQGGSEDARLADPSFLRGMFGRFASGVTVVSCDVGHSVHAMTANSFVSVSLNPARVMVSVGCHAKMHALLKDGRRFGISILGSDQEAASNHFSGRPVDGFEPEFDRKEGAPVLVGALAWMVCVPDVHFDVDDHTLFVGRLTACSYRDDVDPLLFFGGQYAALTR